MSFSLHWYIFSETVNADFNIDEHVKSIQAEADLRGGVVASPSVNNKKAKSRDDDSDSDMETVKTGSHLVAKILYLGCGLKFLVP